MPEPEPERVLRVSELNRYVRVKLERWGEVWIEGEISDINRAASGHLYFTLNDGGEPAQARAVMFRGDARITKAKLEDGERVRVLGTFTFYEPRGTLQIVCRRAVSAGEGDRRAELEKLKEKLRKEGLFAPERKRPLPHFPSVVGIVTSIRGAALHDIVRVATARAPVRLVVADCLVQGPEAPASIVRAIRRMCRLTGVEVVIVARGGGASEDLSAFNDESVARAIAACTIPVVSGVGHEVDQTLADLVADVRAATPSNAAELVVPEREVLRAELDAMRRRIEQAFAIHIGRERLTLERLERRLRDPRRGLGGVRSRFHASRGALERALGRALADGRQRLTVLVRRLAHVDPRAALGRDRAAIRALHHRLEHWTTRLSSERRSAIVRLDARARTRVLRDLGQARVRLADLAGRLDALSPLRVLGRGYAIAIHERSGKALLSPRDAAVGDRLRVQLAEGALDVEVRALRDV